MYYFYIKQGNLGADKLRGEWVGSEVLKGRLRPSPPLGLTSEDERERARNFDPISFADDLAKLDFVTGSPPIDQLPAH